MLLPAARRAALSVSFALFAVFLSGQSAPELYAKAREQVKSGAWRDALKTLDALEAEAARPGNEGMRGPLVAPTAFYRGVCEANLDQGGKAEADFATFLREQPGSTIDHAMYSKKAVAAFEAARKNVGADAARKDGPFEAAGNESASGATTLVRRFEEFKAPPDMGDKPVETFWERRNPRPGSPDNAARAGFERRVAFADAYFRLDEHQRGSLTDPGMVFVLLGPPSRTGRKPIMANEERTISDGAGLDQQWWMGARNSIHIDGQRATNADGFREIWHYGREALPKAVSSYEVNVVFVTKKGYGRFVLQREPATLAALESARSERSKN
jgi:GWxTD domain-containing protein